jgi:hypothetical protein
MKIVSNTKLIRRNKKIGQGLTFGALLILGIGLYFSFTQPEQVTITFGALLFGFLMTQIGIYFGNRWGRSPRPDELLTAGLKGLEDKYTLYHYTADIPHALIGPTGIFALIPISVAGTILYDEKKGRFKQKGGNLYLRIFGQENLGRPEMDAQYTVSDLEKFLRKKFSDVEIPPIEPILVFTHPKANVDANGSPVSAMPLEKLKDNIRKREKSLPLTIVQQIQKGLPLEDIE